MEFCVFFNSLPEVQYIKPTSSANTDILCRLKMLLQVKVESLSESALSGKDGYSVIKLLVMKTLDHTDANKLKKSICRHCRSYISSKEKFAHFKAWPCCADVTAAQIWKSLHIVAAIAVAVLTQGREISTSPNHIPALTLNNTRLSSEPKSKGGIPLLQKPACSSFQTL